MSYKAIPTVDAAVFGRSVQADTKPRAATATRSPTSSSSSSFPSAVLRPPSFLGDSSSSSSSLCRCCRFSASSLVSLFMKCSLFDAQNILIIASIVGFFFTSLSVVFLNRHIFSDTFKYPVFVSFFQQIVGIVLYNIIALPSLCCRERKYFFQFVKFDSVIALRILPLSLLFVGMIGFSNICLKHVQISTYQVARSLTLAFNIALSSLVLHAKASKLVLCACGLVTLGFIVGALDPTTLSLLGVLTGACSSLFQAAYVVLVKKTLTHVGNDQNTILFYNMLISSILFIPVIFLAGEAACFSELPFDFFYQETIIVWFQLILSGVLGLFLALSSYICVRVTTPVTFNVVGYAKACVQSLGGIAVLGEPYTAKSITGISLTLVGSFWYSHIKLRENSSNNNNSRELSVTKIEGEESEDDIEKRPIYDKEDDDEIPTVYTCTAEESGDEFTEGEMNSDASTKAV